MDSELSLEQWSRVSRVLDYIASHKKESGGAVAIRGEPPKKEKKPKKEEPGTQLRLF